jgi:cysteine-rich repeat protein
MVRISLVSLVALVACASSQSQICGDLVCPADAVCDLEHHICSNSDEVLQCVGKDDRAACTLSGQAANCQAGTCQAMVCGNGVVDMNEACDDGNTQYGDGCSADCASRELCGNSIADLQVGEQCDDGNALQHDGCSSTCSLEQAQWLTSQPPGRISGASTFDARLGEVLVFAGVTENAAGERVLLDELWRWNGTWSRVPFDVGPQPRIETAMAYHAALDRTILVGGSTGFYAEMRDTWAWDGRTWTRLPDLPTPGVNGLRAHSMAYDARRKRLVVFGGIHDQLEQDVTYELDDQGKWSVVVTTKAPLGRYSAQMAYDPERGRIVLFGGNGSTGGPVGYNDTWEYDGNWSSISATSPPSDNVMNGAMAFDRVSHRMILVGGQTELQQRSGATYAYNGATKAWSDSTPSINLVTPRRDMTLTDDGHGRLVLFGGEDSTNNARTETLLWDSSSAPPKWVVAQPSVRQNAVAANDLDRRVVVLFGGRNGSTLLDTTWELSTAGWRLVGSGATPMFDMAMTYDPVRRETVRFGGQTSAGSATFTNVTAVWNGSAWTTKSPAMSPTARTRASLAFDVARSEAILFGGNNGARTNETWSWDGSTWTKKSPTVSPSPRERPAMAYDWVRKTIVLFGGRVSGALDGVLDDTWIWDGTNWQEMSVTTRPPPRSSATLVWNPARQRLVLFGGIVGDPTAPRPFDTWEWDGTTWSEVFTDAAPPARENASAYMLVDGSGLGLIHGNINTSLRSDGWQFRYASRQTTEACERAVDNDGDGLSGCDDPDCWASCAPLCPPGPTCDPALPRCGDGTCGPNETCGACSSDCTCTPVCGDFVCAPGETGCLGDCP